MFCIEKGRSHVFMGIMYCGCEQLFKNFSNKLEF